MTTTRGILTIHSAPSALCPHIEWAVGGVFGVPVRLDWRPQPAERAAYRTVFDWAGPVGSSADLTSSMMRWGRLRFEVTEEGTPTSEGERYSFAPSLGVFHATTGRHGDIQVGEDRLRQALDSAGSNGAALRAAVDGLLGAPWDAELEPFRLAGDGAPVRWLHRVG